MSSLGPFSPENMLANIIANIVTEVLKHRSKAFKNGPGGRMLKLAGFIEPSFDDHLRVALTEAFDLFFKTHPEYELSGVMAFFGDPATASQIGSNILERKSIDSKAIRESMHRSIEKDPLSRALIQQRALTPDRMVADFLECYRQVLNTHLSIPEMALLLAILEQSDTLILEMTASEQHIQEFVQQALARVSTENQANTKMLSDIAADLQVIKQKLQLDRPKQEIADEIGAKIKTATRSSMFDSGGWCSGYQFNPMPDRYFLAQAFTPDREDLRSALTKALNEFGVTPVVADDIFWQGYVICKISALIQSTPFGIYQLTKNQNRNVHLELGIAVGLGRPFILVKDRDAEVSPMIQGIEYFPIESYLELTSKMGAKVRPFLTEIGKYKLPSLSTLGSDRTAIIAHGNTEAIDFCVTVARMLSKFNLTSVILGDADGKIDEFLTREQIPHAIVGCHGTKMLDEIVSTVQQARLGVYRIERDCSPDTFVALGISMGLNRPGILVQKRGLEIPADLAGAVKLEFDAYTKFETLLLARYSDFIKRHAV